MLVAAATGAMTLLGCDDEKRDVGQVDTSGGDLRVLEKDKLIVGSEIPFPPFEEGEPPDYEGFDIDVINAVADKLDLETQIENVPLNLILAGDTGDLDLSISAVKITPAREKRVDFSNPYFIDSLSLLVRDDSEIQSVDDVTVGAVIGVEDSSNAEIYARGKTQTSEVRAYSTAREASDALFNSEVDAVIASGPAAEEAIEAREELIVADVIPTREAYGIVLPEDSDALRRAVNSALRELKEDETLTDLYEEYFGVEAPARVATPIAGRDKD
ncbi:MAG: polar amino acid transport system substrate-binding protein [Solirubrobacterales bacterium]|jgi:polar amino acid transport system substrate-binding protein|nr:polar amino acid transport system substrate-binding protein [Solirubrobacterales bacterium]